MDEKLDSFLQSTAAAPPELAADLLLRTVEKGLIKDKSRERQILQDAFALSASATFPFQLVSTGAGKAGIADTDVGLFADALAVQIDRFSLELRVIRRMAHTDAAGALKLFLEIPAPRPPELACEDAMGVSLDEYYATIGDLYSRSFSKAEREKKRDRDFLTTHIAAPQSAWMLIPAAVLLVQLHLSPNLFSSAAETYAQALGDLPADDRTFTATLNFSLMDVLYKLTQTQYGSGGSGYALISSFRNYIDQHIRKTRCSDTGSAAGNAAVLQQCVRQFNERFLSLSPELAKIPTISMDQLKPTGLAGAARVYSFWETPESANLMKAYKHLRFGSGEEQSPEEPLTRPRNMAPYLGLKRRNSDAWVDEATAFLNTLDAWDNKGEPGRAGFHERCLMYDALLAIAPKGDFRGRVVAEYVSFLRSSTVETSSPPEWLLHLSRLLKQKYEEDQSGLDKDIAKSGDATMQLYAQLADMTRSR